MKLSDLKNKKIGILGLGIENQALIGYILKKKISCEITICDARSKELLGDKFKALSRHRNIFWRLGPEFNKRLYEFDILFRSPGWPLQCPGIQEALQVQSPHSASSGQAKSKVQSQLSSPMKLLFDLCPTRNIVGVTGTKGKGTTSSLIYSILKTGGKRVWLGGNIGVAPFAFIDKIKKTDWVVLELSSFQIEDLTVSPYIGVITNFYSEHLAPADPNNPNYHKSLKEYWNAKFNLVKWMKKGDIAAVNERLKKRFPAYALNAERYTLKFFSKSELKSQLPGEHNKENIAAAEIVGKLAGVSQENIAKAVARFKGLEHRIEFVKEINGVRFFDDSFATTPESAIIAMKSFNAPIVLLAGGADKGADFRAMARAVKNRVKFVILFDGQATPRIKKELSDIKFPISNTKVAKSMQQAVELAKSKAEPGDIVLMSTGCASFGMFRNYKERGDLFKMEVRSKK